MGLDLDHQSGMLAVNQRPVHASENSMFVELDKEIGTKLKRQFLDVFEGV